MDAWYDDQKEKALNLYQAALDKQGGREAAEAEFKKTLNNLREQYRLKYDQMVESKRKQESREKAREEFLKKLRSRFPWLKNE